MVVASIRATQEMLKHEQEETLRHLLVAALSEAGSWESKLAKVAQGIQKHIPFDLLVVGVNQEQHPAALRGFFRIGFEEYQSMETIDILRMMGLSKDQAPALLKEITHFETAIWQGDAFAAQCHQLPIKQRLAKLFKVQINLVVPLPLAQGDVFIVSLFSRQANVYFPAHTQLLNRLKFSLLLTLDHSLALKELKTPRRPSVSDSTLRVQEVKTNANVGEVIGKSTRIQQIHKQVSQVAPISTTVLIQGESGTGKELFAKAIHSLSPRSTKPLVKVNCDALPASLIESELFGHERGAFTGAIEKRIGKFELANGGTLFLDEIGKMPLELQSKLLRVLQERKIERIGGKAPIKIDVRIIAATNRNLQQEVAEGRFRLDLFYRLSVFPITLPPLRERLEDVPLIAHHFVQKYCQKVGKPFCGITETALQELMHHHWPGNIRELENIIEQAVILNNGQSPLKWEQSLHPTTAGAIKPLKPTHSMAIKLQKLEDVKQIQQELEPEYILSILQQNNGRIRGKKVQQNY